MDRKIYHQYLEEYVLEALGKKDDDVSAAADYLQNKKKPSIFAKYRKEKGAALKRARKLLGETRDRPVWIVLKSLGLDELAKEKI
ncbi:MAG: hypothetical protein U9O54_00485 [Chloroflexota bacterium]|nr:hypothetical protein [Chloroflexota bacterium]